MNSHHYHNSLTTNTGDHHIPPLHMMLHTTNNRTSLLLDHYAYDETLTTDLQQLGQSTSSSTSASINHKEAEKRRRERINSHLDRLRSLLLCNSKTDKASLLAKVVQRLKELKQTTLEIEDHESIPLETDEIKVVRLNSDRNNGRILVKVSMCCEDQPDLLGAMIQTLKSMQMSPLRVEMVAIGGRIRNIVLGEYDCRRYECGELVDCLKEALSCLLKRNLGSNQSSKRRRMMVCT
uniref:putative transcription factor bHLH107 n=1 Tax=Erigeron canadensis TaxID=72917 RepID=UPI001CB8E21E|nr:putative transcription factor bHLH107 [Erigeron canadensis]